MYQIFPRELGFPKRRLVKSKEEFYKLINIYNGKADVYSSLYGFKMEGNDRKYILDKIYFDIDVKDTSKVKDFVNYIKGLGWSFSIFFSGRHFNLYIFAIPYKPKYPKDCLYNAYKEILEGYNNTKILDSRVIGDVVRISRVPNTLNIKSRRFCIPLKLEDLELGYEKIFELARKQRFESIIYNNKYFRFKKFDYKSISNQIIYSEVRKVSTLSYSFNIDETPKCIEQLLLKKKLMNRERFLVILWLRERGYLYNEVVDILKKYLEQRSFTHCVREEKQVEWIFKREDLLFPTCDRLSEEGFCPGREGCGGNKLKYIL